MYKIVVNDKVVRETEYTMNAQRVYNDTVSNNPQAHVQLLDNQTVIFDTDKDGHKPIYK